MRFRWQNGGLMTSCVLIKSFGFQVWFDFWELFLSTVLIPTFNLLTCFAVATSKTLWCSLLEWKWSTSGELDNWIVLIFIFCNELCWQPMANQTRADYKKVTKKWNECLENWPFALKVKFNRLNLATMFWFCSHMQQHFDNAGICQEISAEDVPRPTHRETCFTPSNMNSSHSGNVGCTPKQCVNYLSLLFDFLMSLFSRQNTHLRLNWRKL